MCLGPRRSDTIDAIGKVLAGCKRRAGHDSPGSAVCPARRCRDGSTGVVVVARRRLTDTCSNTARPRLPVRRLFHEGIGMTHAGHLQLAPFVQ